MDVRVSVALALVHSAGRWLVSRRSDGRVFAGLWEFPGGKIQPGESPAEAAARETLEETGLTVEPEAELGTVQTAHGGQHVILHLVQCRPMEGSAQVRDPAVAEVRWVSSAELGQLPMPPANAEIIERILSQDR